MSYSSNWALNQRVSWLEWVVNQLTPIPPGGYSLANVLGIGNSAGTNDILMNGQDITGANIVETDTLQLTDANNTITTNLGSLVLTSNNSIVLDAVASTPSQQTQIQLNNKQVFFNSNTLVLDSGFQTIASTAGSGGKITIKNAYNSSGIDLIVANGSGVQSTPVAITSATTSITNATTINTLNSTTQPNGTSNTSVATTAFVQNHFNYITPQMWGFTPNNTNFGSGTSVTWTMLFPTGVTMGQNAFVTINVQAEYVFNTPSASGNFPYYQQYSFLMDIYPNRIPFQSGTGICLPNGTINGNNAFSMTDATYAPNGRWYWIRNYQNSSSLPVGAVANPFYFWSNTGLSGGNGCQVLFYLSPPMPNTSTGAWRMSNSCSIVNQGVGAGTITSSGTIASGFGGGAYATTF